MKKFLVNSESEYIKLFREFDLEEVERVIGVEFPFIDGTYVQDLDYNDPESIEKEKQGVDMSRFRANMNAIIPESYPCVVLMWWEDVADRLGKESFRLVEFVYQGDFKKD